MGPHHLERLFNPRSVAVFGASESETSVGGRVFANLAGSGFEGAIHPINPKYKEVLGRRCHASIRELREPVDLAVIASPGPTVAGIFEDCGATGIRNSIVLSAGFGETGAPGRELERELREIAVRNEMRFIGPNCVGLVRPWSGINASFLRSATPPGKLALVSQSGALCSAIADWAEPNHLGFSALVSLGNSVDIGFGDALSFLSADLKTEAILLYVEGVSDARSFISELRAAARIKPVIVLKAGRHHKSATAANTHSGALVGSDAAFEAALERAGAVRAMTFGELFAAAEMLSAHRSASGNRLCIITNGGGAGVLAADRAVDLGVELARPSEETLKTLDGALPAYWSRSNPVDILGDATPAAFDLALRTCLADRSFDGVLVMLTPQAMTDAEDTARTVIEAARAWKGKPVLACWMGETSVAAARHLLSGSGIADFATPERAVEAFSYLARHELNQRLSLETPGPQIFSDRHDVTGARMIIEAALAEGRAMLTDIESKAVLRAFGIKSGTTLEAESPAKALIAAETLGFPVAMKINSPQISHKSDVGGVRTNIMAAGDVRAAFLDIVAQARSARPDAEIRGVTVEAMAAVENARELLVGVTRDPVFGPTIVFGAGGMMVEVLRDSAVALPPLTTVLAERLIDRTRVSHLLDAFRNRPAANRAAVAEVLLRVSDLVSELPHVLALDINPLFAGPDDVIAVDARIQVSRPSGQAAAYEHMAIAPYPKHLVETGFLSDGTPITIRPIRPEDAQSEQAFVRKLSPRAKHFRFMQSMTELTPRMLAQFTQIDYSREMALVATIDEHGASTQLGVARYVINPDGKSCEFAIVVSDDKQKQGIGSRLMTALIGAARGHGLKVMEGLVLSDNKSMLELMRDLSFTLRPYPEDQGIVLVERRL
jgi:acetyltransferase